MNTKTTNENLVNKSNQTQNKTIEMKEVSYIEYLDWYRKLVISKPSDETYEEFYKEVQGWNLYDLSYIHTDKEGIMNWMRVCGIPTPHLQSYLQKYFVTIYDFKSNGISDLRITPHDEKFRNTKLNDGSLQGDFDRSGRNQYSVLYDWGRRFYEKLDY